MYPQNRNGDVKAVTLMVSLFTVCQPAGADAIKNEHTRVTARDTFGSTELS
jgi:hypothetical protein